MTRIVKDKKQKINLKGSIKKTEKVYEQLEKETVNILNVVRSRNDLKEGILIGLLAGVLTSGIVQEAIYFNIPFEVRMLFYLIITAAFISCLISMYKYDKKYLKWLKELNVWRKIYYNNMDKLKSYKSK